MTTPQLSVLACGGIGESGPDDRRTQVSGMLKNVTDKLDQIKFVPQWVPWTDEYGPAPRLDGVSYEESLTRGLDALAAAIRACPNDVVGLGYSAGATLWGRLLEAIEHYPASGYGDLRRKIKGVAFIAHPERNRDDSYNKIGTGWGVGGEWAGGPDEIPIIEIASPFDVICSCDPNSPIRWFADLTRKMSFPDIRTWGYDIRDTILQRKMQAVIINWRNPLGVWKQIKTAADEAGGYLLWGCHTNYDKVIMPGETVTYTDKLAQIMNASIFK